MSHADHLVAALIEALSSPPTPHTDRLAAILQDIADADEAERLEALARESDQIERDHIERRHEARQDAYWEARFPDTEGEEP